MKLSFGKVMKIGCLCVLTAAMVIAVCSIVVFRRSGCSEHKFEFKLHDAEVRTAELNGFRWHYGVICDEAVIFKAIPCTSSSALDRVVLPSMLERYPVHMVVGDVFGACVVIGTLVIPEGITDVGPFAFWGDKVERIELPSTVTNMHWISFKHRGEDNPIQRA